MRPPHHLERYFPYRYILRARLDELVGRIRYRGGAAVLQQREGPFVGVVLVSDETTGRSRCGRNEKRGLGGEGEGKRSRGARAAALNGEEAVIKRF